MTARADLKNGEHRDVPLSTKAIAALQSLPRKISGEVLPVSAEALKKAFTRAVSRAGITDLRFHDLRYEATSRLAEKLDNVLELPLLTPKVLLLNDRRSHLILMVCS